MLALLRYSVNSQKNVLYRQKSVLPVKLNGRWYINLRFFYSVLANNNWRQNYKKIPTATTGLLTAQLPLVSKCRSPPCFLWPTTLLSYPEKAPPEFLGCTFKPSSNPSLLRGRLKTTWCTGFGATTFFCRYAGLLKSGGTLLPAC